MASAVDAKILRRKIGSLWDDEVYADFAIIYGYEEEFVKPAHRAIICTRSRWFKNACKEHFKEGRTGTIKLTSDDPDVIEAALHFLYFAHYANISDPEDTRLTLHFQAKVYAFAEKILSTTLKNFVVKKVSEHLESAGGYDRTDFMEAVGVVYESTCWMHDVLRKRLVRQAEANRSWLFKGEELREMLEGVPAFAADLVYRGVKGAM
ncbi:MAG: hypothetical protein M1831_003471 [Alyxoria varia]|nr:MAG: hypothetical protein M1831_003471 [Alyxoria varia]